MLGMSWVLWAVEVGCCSRFRWVPCGDRVNLWAAVSPNHLKVTSPSPTGMSNGFSWEPYESMHFNFIVGVEWRGIVSVKKKKIILFFL